MKRFLFTAFLAALTLALTSCPGNDPFEPNSADLIGEWEITQFYYIYKENGEVTDEETEIATDDYTITMTFSADGYCISKHYDEGELDDTFHTRWTLSGSTLTIDEDGDEMIYTIEKLDSKTLVFSFQDHSVYEGITYDDYERWTLKKVN